MKFHFFFWGLLGLSQIQVFSQASIDKNFIVVTTMRRPVTLTSQAQSSTVSSGDKMEAIQYFDGLGRPIQTVLTSANPQFKDIITPVEYDSYGREVKQYLPFVNTSQNNAFGSYNSAWTSQQASFYNGQLSGVTPDVSPFTQVVLESSPLNRVLATGAPGAVWQPNLTDPYDVTKKTVKANYETNTAGENIKIWTVAVTNVNFDISQITSPGVYATGQLFVNITTDEHNNIVKEYLDKEQKVILKRVQDDIGWMDTYYIYDQLNRLVAVIQPQGVTELTHAASSVSWEFADKWMFLYRYDYRGRMAMKKIPGADSIVMMYDKWDRLVLVQDGKQRTTNQFIYTKYDTYNRPIITGQYTDASSHQSIRESLMNSNGRSESTTANTYGYTLNQTFPASINEDFLLTVSYYDNYSSIPWINSGFTFTPENAVPSTAINYYVKGLITGTLVKVGAPSNTWIRTATYYDNKYRPVQIISENVFQKKERITRRLAFDGLVEEEWNTHNSDFYPAGILTIKKYSYDHAGRLLTVKSAIGSQAEVTLADNQYNQLGQLITKKLHTTTANPVPLQQMDYGYNIRGWLTNVNRAENTAGVTAYDPNDLFAFELNYNTTAFSGSTAQFNGNISEQKWKGPMSETPRAFSYSYDKANRIKTSRVSEYVNSNWTALSTKYAEDITLYDKNGNIKNLNRYHNAVQIDQMSYSSYSGNKLLQVDDPLNSVGVGFKNGTNSGNDYTYDAAGNMLSDQNKGIGSITYNYLNLPEVIEVPGKGTITYTYDAAGNKLSKVINENIAVFTAYYYIGAFVYKKSWTEYDPVSCNGCFVDPSWQIILPLQPELILHEEGRIRLKNIDENYHLAAGNASYQYDYFMKDHLGNVRLVITAEQQTDIYAATLELGPKGKTADKENQLFNNISTSPPRRVEKPANFDPPGSSANALVYKLSGTTGNQVGISKVLKVMAGDKISMEVRAYYEQNQTPSPDPNFLSEIVTILTGGIVTNGGIKGGANTPAGITGIVNPIVNDFLANNPDRLSYNSSRPKAFLNYIYFDENFAVVSSGAKQVEAGAPAPTLVISPVNNIVQKHGYLYVFLSNESPTDVYFDDLKISHVRGPVLEESHYYSFGMVIPNLSTSAIGKGENRYKYNGKELQSREFSDGSGLEWEDYGARMYDAQIGRFFKKDRFAELYFSLSNYQYTANNPINFTDENGDYIIINKRNKEGGIEISLMYENGKAYYYSNDKNGNIVKGREWDGTDAFVKQTISDLSKISTTFLGNSIIKDLQSSKYSYTIGSAQTLLQSGFSSNTTDGTGGGTILYFQRGGKHADADINNSEIVLGHELFHAWAFEFTYQPNGNTYGDHLSRETKATQFENYLRASFGEKVMREYYTMDRNGNREKVASPDVNIAKKFVLPKAKYLYRTPTNRRLDPSVDETYYRFPYLQPKYVDSRIKNL